MLLDEWLGYPVVNYYKGLNLRLLPMNHAYVMVNTTVDDVSVYGVDKNCFNCPYKHHASLVPNEETIWMIDSRYEKYWRIKGSRQKDFSQDSKQGLLCQLGASFDEYGVYRLDIGKCEITTEVPPANTYLPLILCSVVLFGVFFVYYLVKYLWNRRKNRKNTSNEGKKVLEINVGETEDEPSTLNIFRGLLLSLIIFATTGGGGYSIFLRSENSIGLSVAECLYFAFAWSVGFNIPTVMDKAFNQLTKRAIIKDIFSRFLVFLFVDVIINSVINRNSSNSFTPDDLWRPLLKLGIAYLVAASAYVFTMQRFEMKSKKIICKAVSNFISLMWCWIISGFILAVIAILISTLISLNCLSNLDMTTAVDFSKTLSEESFTCNNDLMLNANIYMANRHEEVINVHGYLGFSQGIMGQMSILMFTIIGLKAGFIYANYETHSDRLKLWSIWAMLFGLGGIFFGAVSYPLEFNLRPIAMILLLSTMTMLSFAVVYIITEVRKLNSYILSSAGVTFFLIFPAHMLFSNGLPFTWALNVGLEMFMSQHMKYIIYSYSMVLIWLLVSVIIMKKKVTFAV
ncbi:uncharacterized protein LOC113236318 [Hyposmocoma kahamanoa]|uniref:uncharacterized protein LOC113236318 n=1 Tax=Hyposmocoma kahamanoa TaxID=1477025 RepID=UPI000E6D65ED|nr:uncharacterized protein LOC113236318 [Hyposmocoma kahamanoa]XP_026328118.1 uncharacterized protein LOC113236318 [Hyposmocoma kahamanoa]